MAHAAMNNSRPRSDGGEGSLSTTASERSPAPFCSGCTLVVCPFRRALANTVCTAMGTDRRDEARGIAGVLDQASSAARGDTTPQFRKPVTRSELMSQ